MARKTRIGRGTFHGLTYVDSPYVPTGDLAMSSHAPAGARGSIILHGPETDNIRNVESLHEDAYAALVLAPSVGFQVPGIAEAFPDRAILFHRYSWRGFDIRAWLESIEAFPAYCDIRVDWDPIKADLALVARTKRAGRIVEVARDLPAQGEIRPRLANVLGHFARRCPAPRDKATLSCSPMTATFMGALTEVGLATVEDWMRRIRDEDGTLRGDAPVLAIPRFHMTGPNRPRSLRLRLIAPTDGVYATAAWTEALSISEDLRGGHVTLEDTPLPHTVLQALPGMPLARLLDEDWAADQTVARVVDEDGATVVRTRYEAVPFLPAASGANTDDDARAELDGLGPTRWTHVTHEGLAAIEGLGFHMLAAALTALACSPDDRLDLAFYGKPGWMLLGATTTLDAHGPIVPFADALKRAAPGD